MTAIRSSSTQRLPSSFAWPARRQVLEARRLLQASSQNGIGEAALLTGEVLLQLIKRDLQGTLTDDYKVVLDSLGQAHAATSEELIQRAQLWLEKAAGAGMTPALRYLGLMKARGLGSKADFVSAASLWKEAADRGDTVSQIEIGGMLTFGHGVQADLGEAARYLRLATNKRPEVAFQLSSVLLPKSLSGDEAATKELKALLTRFLDSPQAYQDMAVGQQGACRGADAGETDRTTRSAPRDHTPVPRDLFRRPAGRQAAGRIL